MVPDSPRQIRIFCDSDVLIAGAASTTGASHILLQLSAAATAGQADFLATFNLRHFRPRKAPPPICQPGVILSQIRLSLTHMLN